MGCVTSTRDFAPDQENLEEYKLNEKPGPFGVEITSPGGETPMGTKEATKCHFSSASSLPSSSASYLTPREQPPSPSETYPGDLDFFWTQKYQDADLAKIVAKGFDPHIAVQMLEIANGDAEFALVMLRESQCGNTPTNEKKRFSFKDVKIQPTNECGDNFTRPPKANEVDYVLHFEPPRYGFEIKSGFNECNAIVSQTIEQHAVESLMPSSLVVAVNSTCVLGRSLDEIRHEMRCAVKKGLVKMRFRAKRELLDKFWVHGTLVIIVLGGQALKSAATHATVRVNHATLATNPCHASKNPIWNNTVSYQNIYSARIGRGCLSVYRTRMTGAVEIGTAWFELPTKSDEIQNLVLELRDRKGNVSGLVPIKMMLKSQYGY